MKLFKYLLFFITVSIQSQNLVTLEDGTKVLENGFSIEANIRDLICN